MLNKKPVFITVNKATPASIQTPIHNVPNYNKKNNYGNSSLPNKSDTNDIKTESIYVHDQITRINSNNKKEMISLKNETSKNLSETGSNRAKIKIMTSKKKTNQEQDTKIINKEKESSNTEALNKNTQNTAEDKPKSLSKKNNFTSMKWGVFMGPEPKNIREFESIIKTNPDYLAYFVHWGNGGGKLPDFLKAEARDKGRDLVLFWEASDYTIGGINQPKFSYKSILNGKWDNYIKDFVKQLKDYKGKVILIPFSELNGNWTPWSGTTNGNTPKKAIEGFRYVSSFFKNIPNVKIGWAINAASVPDTSENQIENYYPGDNYVDIVGVDGFNDGPPWFSFAEIFDKPLNKLSKYNKPIFIFSFASAEGPNKASWMRDGFFTQMPKYPKLKAWIWFNQDKERNWLIWSDEDSLAVFKEAVGE